MIFEKHITFDDAHVLEFEGEKSKTLLHGQLTNSVNDLAEGQLVHNLLLNLKGKVRAEAWLWNHKNILMICDSFSAPILTEHFQKLAPLSRVKITTRTPTNSDLEFFKNLGFKNLSAKEFEFFRIKNGKVRVGVEACEDKLPQECRFDSALHFKKGCYLGQEIIARLHFRGHINRVFAHGSVPNLNPQTGDKIFCGDEEIGAISSACFDQTSNTSYFLAYVPVKFLDKNLTTCGTSIQLIAPQAQDFTKTNSKP